MMHAYLRDADDWERFMRLLAAFPGREAELSARASLLVQEHMARGLAQDEAVRLALEEAPRVQFALGQREVAAETRAPPRRVPWRLVTAIGAGMAAGLAIGVLLPRAGGPGGNTGLTYRGAPAWNAGTVALWGDALVDAPLRESVGRGVSPIVHYRPGKLLLQWIPTAGTEGAAAVAWLVDAAGARTALDGQGGGFTSLSEATLVAIPPGGARLVVLVYPAGEQAGPNVDAAADGTRAAGLAGSWQMIAFQLVEDRP